MNQFDPAMSWASDVRAISRQQVVLRLLVFVSPLAAIVAGDRASETSPATTFTSLVVVLALIAAALPDSHAGFLVLAVVGLYWASNVDDPTTPWTLVAALCLLLFHAASAAASLTPARASIDTTTRRRWTNRVGIVAVATCAVWVLVAAAASDREAGSVASTVAALLLAAGLAWFLLRRTVVR